jgi:AraC family transcriptional regulator of arabinose operon
MSGASWPPGRVLPVTPAPVFEAVIAGTQLQTRETHRGYRPGGSKDWLCIATLDGQGYVRAGQEIVTLTRGDMLLFSPHTPQEYGYLGEDIPWSNLWVHFQPRPHWIPWLVWPQRAKGIMLLDVRSCVDLIEDGLQRLIDAQNRPTRRRHDKALNALELVLMICDEINPLHQVAPVDQRIQKALDIVGRRLAEPLNVNALARAVGLSRSRFSVLFAEQTNLSPQAYIEFVRLNRAAQLLRMSSWPIGQIAGDVGFSNPYYFSTRFKAYHGLSPSDYRDLPDAGSETGTR